MKHPIQYSPANRAKGLSLPGGAVERCGRRRAPEQLPRVDGQDLPLRHGSELSAGADRACACAPSTCWTAPGSEFGGGEALDIAQDEHLALRSRQGRKRALRARQVRFEVRPELRGFLLGYE